MTVTTSRHIDVLIVGAGPSGLMLAAQLLRMGVQPTVIDAKQGPERTSRAIAVHARSLELFRQLGLADRLVAEGVTAYGLQVQGRSGRLVAVDFAGMESPRTAYPFVLLVSQEKTERLLIDRLTENACPVHWDTRLESVRQDDQAVTVTVQHGGDIEQWSCGWVVGADGVGSTVRRDLGIRFDGKRYKGRFFLADVEIDGEPLRSVHFFLPRDGLLGIFPMDRRNRYRVVGSLPDGLNLSTDAEPSFSDLKQLIDRAVGFDLPVRQCLWISVFVQRRGLAEQFARQRCFLIGDAAHVHSPIGGQGMNGGLQDAVNLAWKLAGVVSGRLHPRILYTYQEERQPVARAVIRATDQAFQLGLWFRGRWSGLRDRVLARLLPFITGKTRWRQHLFETAAQLRVSYRHGPLAVHHAAGSRIRSGDRLPFVPVFDEKAKVHTDLHRWCEKPGFTLLLLGTVSQHHLHIIGQWIRQQYPRGMHFYYLPYSPANQTVFDAFEIRPEGHKIVLVRPDMHIGYINDMVQLGLIDTYMAEIVGWKS